jgi:hypothetical protein
MRIFNKTLGKILIISIGAAYAFIGLNGPISAIAATSPDLGGNSTYAVISSTYTNSLNAALETDINGDLCYTTGPGTTPVSISGSTVVPCADARGTDQSDALADLNAQADLSCNDLGVNVVLSGTYTPGCYSSSGTMDITLGTTVTLNGAGTYIFRSAGALTTGTDSVVELTGGASAADVFWVPNGHVVIGANSSTSATPTFVGNILQNSLAAFDVTIGHFVNLLGRVMAFGRVVTTDSNTITVPDISTTLHIIKTVINDNGGTAVASDFTINVAGTNVSSSSFAGSASGVDITLDAGAYSVTEPVVPAGYLSSSSGDCSGTIAIGETKICIITNDDIPSPTGGGGTFPAPVPPLIEVVKVPNPLALPEGSGSVTYTYTLRNIGTILVKDITMVDNFCSPLTFVSGDANSDAGLDVNETWTYTCSTTLSKTHTNIVTATRWGWERGSPNGISATDVANATVVVGAPAVPPLIHVTKVPNPLALSAEGGTVAYTNKVTNPGTVALSNIRITDDKCGFVKYISGDANSDSKLDTSETWTYTCSSNLTKTTVNTVTARGDANGLTAKDFAIATVVVSAAVPKLPNTGLPYGENNIPWNIVAPAGIFGALIFFYFARKKQIA